MHQDSLIIDNYFRGLQWQRSHRHTVTACTLLPWFDHE
jgi:hypothetical protein